MENNWEKNPKRINTKPMEAKFGCSVFTTAVGLAEEDFGQPVPMRNPLFGSITNNACLPTHRAFWPLGLVTKRKSVEVA